LCPWVRNQSAIVCGALNRARRKRKSPSAKTLDHHRHRHRVCRPVKTFPVKTFPVKTFAASTPKASNVSTYATRHFITFCLRSPQNPEFTNTNNMLDYWLHV
jgi:hypothetical protein